MDKSKIKKNLRLGIPHLRENLPEEVIGSEDNSF
jgi:hypothetical protein